MYARYLQRARVMCCALPRGECWTWSAFKLKIRTRRVIVRAAAATRARAHVCEKVLVLQRTSTWNEPDSAIRAEQGSVLLLD